MIWNKTKQKNNNKYSLQESWQNFGLIFSYFVTSVTVVTSTGCSLILYPGAFNMTTGPAHWELLARARYVAHIWYVIGCLSVFLSVCLSLSVCMFVYYVCRSVCLSEGLSLSLSLYVCVFCLHVCLSVCLSSCLSVWWLKFYNGACNMTTRCVQWELLRRFRCGVDI